MDRRGRFGGPHRRQIGDFLDAILEGAQEAGEGFGRKFESGQPSFILLFKTNDDISVGGKGLKVGMSMGSRDAFPEERRVIASHCWAKYDVWGLEGQSGSQKLSHMNSQLAVDSEVFNSVSHYGAKTS